MSQPSWSLVSVLIPARNAAATLSVQLGALAAQDYEGAYEVLVVDNGSTDGTAEVALAYQDALPRLRVIPATERSGVNYVRNAGARSAEGEVILICDADDVVGPSWVRAMVEKLQESDAVGGPLEVLEPCDKRIRLLRKAGGGALHSSMGFLPYPAGCNCGVRATVFETLGGFDERYANGADDAEFFWRLQLAGFRLGFAPEGVINYRLRDTVRATVQQKYNYAKGKPLLYKEFRPRGLPRRRLLEVSKSWGWLIITLPRLIVGPSERRAAWLRSAISHAGYVVGSFKHRTWYLG